MSHLLLALVQSQSPLDQSNSWGEGCRAPYLQYEHDILNLSHTFVGTGAFMSTLSSSNTFASRMLGLLVFIGLNLFLPDHLVLILPVVCFIRFLVILVGAEIWMHYQHSMVLSFPVFSSSWNPCIFHLREGNGITFLLHGVKIMDSMVWSFLYVYIPITVLTVRSMSTMSVNKQVLIDPKIKLQTGLISLAISTMLYQSFRCFLSQHPLKLIEAPWIPALTLNEKALVDFPSYV